jgi:hypothetical protein
LNSGFKGDGSTELEDATRKFSEAAATHFSRGIRGYLGWLLLVIGAAPFVAEVCALVALSQDRASQAILVVTWIGLGVKRRRKMSVDRHRKMSVGRGV